MGIDDLGKATRNRLDSSFEAGRFDRAVAGFYGRRLALDVGQDARYLGNVVAQFAFQPSDPVVSFLQNHAFIQFDVLLDMQLPANILDADVVDVEVVSGGYRSNAIKQAFLKACA